MNTSYDASTNHNKIMIPKKDSAFASWLAVFAAAIVAAPTTYGLTVGDATAINNVNTTFQAAYATATDPATRTAPTIAAKNSARAAAEVLCRPYAVQISLNASVTDEAKVAAGVTVRKTVPTPIPAPVDAPELAVQKAIPGVVTIAAKVPGSTGKAKPTGAIGLEVVRSAGTVAAVDPAQCSFLGTFTKSPLRVDVAPSEVGKTITVFARYTTRSGPAGVAQSGPWSAPLVFAGM